MRLTILFPSLLLALVALGGCATLSVELEQRPYQGAAIAQDAAARRAAVLGVIDSILKTGKAPDEAPKTAAEAAVIAGLANTDAYVKLPELPKPK